MGSVQSSAPAFGLTDDCARDGRAGQTPDCEKQKDEDCFAFASQHAGGPRPDCTIGEREPDESPEDGEREDVVLVVEDLVCRCQRESERRERRRHIARGRYCHGTGGEGVGGEKGGGSLVPSCIGPDAND